MTCADRSTDTKKNPPPPKKKDQNMSHVTCHLSYVTCHVLSCHVMSCHVMSCHDLLCLVISCQNYLKQYFHALAQQHWTHIVFYTLNWRKGWYSENRNLNQCILLLYLLYTLSWQNIIQYYIYSPNVFHGRIR